MYYTRSKLQASRVSLSEGMHVFSLRPYMKYGARDVIGNSITIFVGKGPILYVSTECTTQMYYDLAFDWTSTNCFSCDLPESELS